MTFSLCRCYQPEQKGLLCLWYLDPGLMFTLVLDPNTTGTKRENRRSFLYYWCCPLSDSEFQYTIPMRWCLPCVTRLPTPITSGKEHNVEVKNDRTIFCKVHLILNKMCLFKLQTLYFWIDQYDCVTRLLQDSSGSSFFTKKWLQTAHPTKPFVRAQKLEPEPERSPTKWGLSGYPVAAYEHNLVSKMLWNYYLS